MLSRLARVKTLQRNLSTTSTAAELGAPRATGILSQMFGKSSTPAVPLTHAFDGSFDPPAGVVSVPGAAETSTLSNGVRVASVSSASSPIANVGLLVDVGARDETFETLGACHVLEQLAFKSNARRSAFAMVRESQARGVNLSVQPSREQMFYTGEALREHVPFVVEALSDVVSRHEYHQWELDEVVAEVAGRDSDELPDVMESLHQAAYHAAGLGTTLEPGFDSVSNLSREALVDFVAQHYTAKRTVLFGVGVDHAELVALGEEHLSDMSAAASPERAPAQYVGGDMRTHSRKSGDGMAQVALGWETANWHHDDLIPLFVLQMMLGGGGSFSAGGPGKGMYSRLYRTVLNQHGWVAHASSFNSVYSDSGLFGFYGMSAAEHVTNLIEVLGNSARTMADNVSDEELNRAKAQLKSSVHMHLENRPLLLEDLGRSIAIYGKYEDPHVVSAKIDKVTQDDLKRVASSALATPLSLASSGDLSHMPRYEQVAGFISS